jgi:PAS domain S-box-containing protein
MNMDEDKSRLDDLDFICRLREENESLHLALEETEYAKAMFKQKEEFTLLLDASKLIVAEADANKVLQLVAQKALDIVEADMVVIPILNDARDHYTYMAAAGENAEQVIGETFATNVGMCGWVLQHERSLLYGKSTPFWMDEKTVWEEGQPSALLVPLFGKSKIIGGVSALGKKGGGTFTEHDLDLLTVFANQVSIAIEKAFLFQQLSKEIEERKQAEEALRRSEERFRAVFEHSWDAIGVSEAGVHVFVNPAYLALFGFEPGTDLKGKPILDLIAPGSRGEIADRMRRRLEDAASVPTVYETRGLRVDGSEFDMEVRVSTYREDGKNYTLVILRNISEIKRAESLTQARLRILSMSASPSVPREELLQKMLDEIEKQSNSTIGFFHFLDADQETLTLQVWSSNTLLGGCVADGPAGHADISQAGAWANAVHERRPIIHNDYASLPDRRGLPPGHAEVTREMVVPFLRNNRIVAIIGVGNKPADYTATDVQIVQSLGHLSWEIFERIRAVAALESAHAEIQRHSRELAATNKELEAFSYSVSHDLRSPLRTIAGFSDLLLRRYADKLDDDGKEYIGWVKDGVAKMDRIIEELLHLSRLSRHEVQRQQLDLSKITQWVVKGLGDADPERTVVVDIQEGVQAFADLKLIEVALSNLLGNAWKFTAKKENPVIRFGTTEQEGKTVYYVKDNGAGFDQGTADKLFIPFQRLHSQDEFEGTGIGLAIVERVVRRHGGKIWAEGKKDEGATFYFTLGREQ